MWKGFVESKIRHLLAMLEKFSGMYVHSFLEFRPWPTTYTVTHHEYPFAEASFIGIRFNIEQDPDRLIKSDILDLKKTLELFYSKI